MKFLIYGAGVIGSIYAGLLQEAGHEVTVLARGERLAQVRDQGIRLVDEATGRRTSVSVQVVGGLAPGDRYDWIIVAIPGHKAASAMAALSANVSENILLFFNTAAGPGKWVGALGAKQVALGFAGAGGGREGAVVRYVLVRRQPTTLGELSGRGSPRLEQLAAVLKEAGLPVALEPSMDAWLKTHAAAVSALANAIYAVGGDYRALVRRPEVLGLAVDAMREGFAVVSAHGLPLRPVTIGLLRLIPKSLLVPAAGRALSKGGPGAIIWKHAEAARDEMAGLTGELQALARQVNLPTPAIDRLARLAGSL